MERNLSKPIIINSYPGNGIILLVLNRRERMTTQLKAWHQRTLGLHLVMLFLTLKLQQIALRAKLRIVTYFIGYCEDYFRQCGNFYHMRGIQRESDREIQRNREV